ncbi:MAG TPA: FKBP-type peptidyl-prolyl cis-trans isomerase [Bacteroidia bacterium]|nr:FKBP-type peptidyl-prolyl cis-trans isomerase [Bacteroidia bacterium]
MKSISFKKSLLLLASGIFIFSSCSKSPYPGYKKDATGLYYKFYNQNDKGQHPKEGDIVSVRMLYKNSKDSVLFNSKKFSRDSTGAIRFPLAKSTFKGSFEDALSMMAVGDSASFLINADSLYLKTFKAKELPKYVVSGTMLTFEAKLVGVMSKEEAAKQQQEMMEKRKAEMELRKGQEPQTIQKYLTDNKVTVKPTESGIYYIKTIKGNGPKVIAGDTVQVTYKGMLLDGSVFDTSDRGGDSKPVKFPVGVGAVIKGWDEVLQTMNQGEQVRVLIPSSMAYGEMSPGGMIQPYSPLLFDISIVKVIKGKPVEKQKPMKEMKMKEMKVKMK